MRTTWADVRVWALILGLVLPSSGRADEGGPSEAIGADVVELPPPGEGLPSALDVEGSEDSVEDGESVSEGSRWRGATSVRPRMAMWVRPGGIKPMALGIAVGRRWWRLGDGVVRAAIDVGGDGEVVLAKGSGSWVLSSHALVGPWFFSRLGLLVGPAITGDRIVSGDERLPAAMGLEARVRLVCDLGVISLSGGVAPRWLIVGSREAAGTTLGGVGDELLIDGGIGVQIAFVRLSVSYQRHTTALGPIDRWGLGFRLSL